MCGERKKEREGGKEEGRNVGRKEKEEKERKENLCHPRDFLFVSTDTKNFGG